MDPKIYTKYSQPAGKGNGKLYSVIIILLLIACAALGGTFVVQSQFKMVNTSPELDKVGNLSPFIKVNYNKELAVGSASVSSGSKIVKSTSTSGKTLTINLNYPLHANWQYEIDINSITSVDSKTLTDKKLLFTTQNIAFNDMPSDQKKAVIANQDHYTPAQQDPIVGHLPYGAIDFNINPTFPTKNGKTTLVLEAQLLLAPGVTGAEANADTAQYKQELLDWIRSLGLDPARYTIHYTVVHEQLTGA